MSSSDNSTTGVPIMMGAPATASAVPSSNEDCGNLCSYSRSPRKDSSSIIGPQNVKNSTLITKEANPLGNSTAGVESSHLEGEQTAVLGTKDSAAAILDSIRRSGTSPSKSSEYECPSAPSAFDIVRADGSRVTLLDESGSTNSSEHSTEECVPKFMNIGDILEDIRSEAVRVQETLASSLPDSEASRLVALLQNKVEIHLRYCSKNYGRLKVEVSSPGSNAPASQSPSESESLKSVSGSPQEEVYRSKESEQKPTFAPSITPVYDPAVVDHRYVTPMYSMYPGMHQLASSYQLPGYAPIEFYVGNAGMSVPCRNEVQKLSPQARDSQEAIVLAQQIAVPDNQRIPLPFPVASWGYPTLPPYSPVSQTIGNKLTNCATKGNGAAPIKQPMIPVSPHVPTVARVDSLHKRSRRTVDRGVQCQQCGTNSTPEWRRGPDGLRTLCNACGLFHAKIARRKGEEEAMRLLRKRKAQHSPL